MEKKATLLLFHFILVISTYIIAGLTVAAWFSGIIPPQKSWSITVLALAMIPLLALNAAFLILWAVRLKFLFIVPAAAILLNAGFIVSMFRIDLGDTPRERGEQALRIATYNIHGYAQRDVKGMLEGVVNYIRSRDMDIIGFQEFPVTERFPLDSIRKIFDGYMPYCVAGGHEPDISVALFSRYPITAHDILRFENTHNGALWADVALPGRTVRVFNAHFQTTSLGQSGGELASMRENGIADHKGKRAFDVVMKRLRDNALKRVEQVNAVRAVMDTTQRPVIVCGDFNSTPSMYTYKRIKRGLRDGFRQCGNGYASTFKPMMGLLRLDYILYDKRLAGLWYHSPDLMWSDHNPVMMELRLRNGDKEN